MQQRFLLPLSIYMLCILLIGINIFQQPEYHTIGWLGTDAMDTMSLRWLFFHPEARFAPFGYDFAQLTPNILDHLTAYPLIALFGFPQGDNLWWFAILLANTFSAHLLGRRLGGDLGGFWAGFLILSSEQLLREVNLHHAPQAMLFFPLLYCWSLLNIEKKKDALISGLFLGFSGYGYLYTFLFIFLGTLPLFLKQERRYSLIILGTALVSLAPNIGWLFWMSPELIQAPQLPPIQGKTMLELHSGGFDFLWQNQPFDLSNQVSFLALGISGWMLWKKREWISWKTGLFCFGLGSFMVLGTHNPLFVLFRDLPVLSRLSWPERWGILLPIGLIFCSAGFFKHQHRLLWRLPPLLLLEMFLRSGNLPLHAESTRSYQCYAALQKDTGLILELPLAQNDLLYNRSALFQRLHLRPMINPFVLPPMVSPPKNWEEWKDNPWLQALDNPDAAQTIPREELAKTGISSIIIDRSSFSPLSSKDAEIWKENLSKQLDEPIDLGCLWLWHIGEEESKRKNIEAQHIEHPTLAFPLLMEPINQK